MLFGQSTITVIMFGLILPSRPVLTHTSLLTISPTQFAFTFPSLPYFSHIVIFLIPGNELPIDTAAAVYIQFPGSAEFRLLGAIANEKQSAIFRVNGSRGLSNGAGRPDGSTADGEVDMDAELATPTINVNGTVIPGDVTIGISIEPSSAIAAQLASAKAQSHTADSDPSTSTTLAIMKRPPSPPSTKLLAQRIIKNVFNFLASFAGGQGGEEVVPLRSFQDWWTKFERRVENDPGFLEREVDG